MIPSPLTVLAWVATAIAVAVMLRIGWELVHDPWKVMDLSNSAGGPDHGKRAAMMTFIALYALAWGYMTIQRDLHWMIWSLLAVLPFGIIGLRIYFGARRQTVEPPEQPLPQTEPPTSGDPTEPNLWTDDERG